jgi:hypothetical protein
MTFGFDYSTERKRGKANCEKLTPALPILIPVRIHPGTWVHHLCQKNVARHISLQSRSSKAACEWDCLQYDVLWTLADRAASSRFGFDCRLLENSLLPLNKRTNFPLTV